MKGVRVRGYLGRFLLPLAAVAVFAAFVSGAGARVLAGKAAQATTLVVGTEGDPVALDGALVSDGTSLRVLDQISEGLVDLKPGTLQVVPSLATSWKGTKQGAVWTFQLRHGVKFQDGTPFNAKAVCFNFNRWYNFSGSFQNPDATYYWQTVFGGFKSTVGKPDAPAGLGTSLYRSCTTLGRYGVRINLTRKSASFLGALALRNFAIMSPTALVKYGANKGTVDSNGVFHPSGTFSTQHPIGTGPFKLQTWTLGERIVLVRNSSYWGPKAKVSQLIFRPIADNAARLQALQTGEVQAYDLVAPEDVPTIRNNSNLKVLDRSPFNVAYIGFNQAKPPMDKLAVRQAVAYGLDRQAVVKAFFLGRGKVANEFMPPGLFGYAKDVAKYPYNPSKAKSLLQKAGLTLPVKLDFYYFTRARAYLPDPKSTFEAFKASLENSGFSITPHVLPFRPDFLSAVNRGDAGHLYMVGWNGDWGDPDDWVGVFFKHFQKAWGFTNPKLFNLLTRAQGEPNFKKRVKLYEQANRYIMKFLPGVPFAHNRSAMAAQRRVKNLLPSPVQIERYSLVSLG
jgi:peptide/nickel transport system substrate-binding protein